MIRYADSCAHFEEVVGIEEASGLLEWLQSQPQATLDLSACSHMHAANLQVLLVKRPRIVALPSAPNLNAWLTAALAVEAEMLTA